MFRSARLVWLAMAFVAASVRAATETGTPPEITGVQKVAGTDGVSTFFSYSILVTGTDPVTLAAVLPLPSGLTLSGTTLSGTPTAAGFYKVPIVAENAAGVTAKYLAIQTDVKKLVVSLYEIVKPSGVSPKLPTYDFTRAAVRESVPKLQASVVFNKSNADRLSFNDNLPASFANLEGKTFVVDLGMNWQTSGADLIGRHVLIPFKMNAKGSSAYKSVNKIKVSKDLRVTVSLKNGNFASALGLPGTADLKCDIRQIVITVLADNNVYTDTTTVSYSVRAGKSGKAVAVPQ